MLRFPGFSRPSYIFWSIYAGRSAFQQGAQYEAQSTWSRLQCPGEINHSSTRSSKLMPILASKSLEVDLTKFLQRIVKPDRVAGLCQLIIVNAVGDSLFMNHVGPSCSLCFLLAHLGIFLKKVYHANPDIPSLENSKSD